MMTLMIFLALFPYTAGTPEDAILVSKMGNSKPIPVLCTIDVPAAKQNDSKEWIIPMQGLSGRVYSITITLPNNQIPSADTFGNGEQVIALLQRSDRDGNFLIAGITAVKPLLILPYIVGLEERARILYFHVPMSWIAFLAYIISMIFSIKLLRKYNSEYDIIASSSAALGTVFCILATVTGAVWAKFNWGSFWNWDPRETSIFVLLLIYGAYFVLRSAIENEESRARLSAVYAILGAVAAVFFIYIAPRIYGGLHPGSADDSNSGPVLSQQEGSLNILKQIILSLAFCSFTIVYFWLLNLASRIRIASRTIEHSSH